MGSGSARGLKGAVALATAAALATAGLLVASPAVADDATITVLPTDIGQVVGETTAPWTKANADNLAGRYEIVQDAAEGVLLELETVGGAMGVGTQAKFMHYFASGAYPAIDASASVIGTDPVASVPLPELLAHPITATYRSTTYLSLQIEIRYGTDKFATIYQNGAAAASWASFSVDSGKLWTISRALTDAAGTTIAVCGASGNRACTNGQDVKLADLLDALADQAPRAISVGVNKGRDTNPVNAGLVQVRDIAFGGMTFRFGLPPSLHVDPYFVSGALYQGIGVDLRATGVSDATEVRVSVHRSLGGDVVKTSRPDGSVLATVNAGNAVTAPIVIQAGKYDEPGSGSWVPAVAGGAAPIWTQETLPTGVTVELLRGDEVIVEQTVSTIGTTLATLADVMPAAPRFTTPTAAFRNAENYRGITVDIRVDGVRDAEQILVQVDRAGAQPVVKKSKWTAASALNTGRPVSITAPIVIQPGTYDEAASSSWFKPVAVWTPTSVPTSVTVTIKRTYGPDLVTTLAITGSSAGILPTTTPTAPIVVEIPTDTPTYEVDVPTGAEDIKLNLGTPAATGGGAEISVPVEVVVTTQVGANVTIAANTKVTSADPAWDGVVQLPKVRTDVVVPAASGQATTVGVAIELGSPTTRLDFDTPVKLVLADQAGKRAGYIDQSGGFHAIATACPAVMPDDMATDECWVDDGTDLVIWTTHFTTFVSYTSAATPAPGGGGSGSGGASSGSTGGSSAGGGVTTGSSTTLVPAPVTAATPGPTPTATPKPTVSSVPSADVPEEEVDPVAAVPQEAGGFDPVLLVVIVIAVALVGAGVATIVTLRRRARA